MTHTHLARLARSGLLFVILLTACGPQVTMLTEVTLVGAAPIPTSTPLPDTDAVATHRGIEKSFLDVDVHFESPASWGTIEGVQYVMAYNSEAEDHFPRLGLIITRAINEAGADPIVAVNREFFLHWFPEGDDWQFMTTFYASRNWVIDGTDHALALGWGGRPAAVRTANLGYRPSHRQDPITVTQVQIALRVDEDDLLTVIASTPNDRWDALQPALAGMLESLTVNGSTLPAEQMLQAMQAL